MTYAKMVGRVALTVGTVASLQGCAALSNVRVRAACAGKLLRRSAAC